MSTPTPGRSLDDPLAQIRADVAWMKATLPHLATKAELADTETRLAREIAALNGKIERVDGDIARLEPSLVQWLVGATLASGGLAFTAAKLIH